jgi:predicted secreted protein
MASFTNLALSAASLGTRYMNEIYTITREVRDRVTGAVTGAADYSELGRLLIVVTVISVVVPLLTVLLVQYSRLRTSQ